MDEEELVGSLGGSLYDHEDTERHSHIRTRTIGAMMKERSVTKYEQIFETPHALWTKPRILQTWDDKRHNGESELPVAWDE